MRQIFYSNNQPCTQFFLIGLVETESESLNQLRLTFFLKIKQSAIWLPPWSILSHYWWDFLTWSMFITAFWPKCFYLNVSCSLVMRLGPYTLPCPPVGFETRTFWFDCNSLTLELISVLKGTFLGFSHIVPK